MEATIRPKKKSAAGKVVFWLLSPVWLVLIVALLAFGALNLFGFTYDDQAALLAQPPMSAGERYAFHAGERTVDVALDPADLTFILSEQADADPAALQAQLKEMGVDLAAYGLTLESYGIRFDDGAYITLLFRWLGFVPVPLRLDVEVAAEDDNLNIRVTDVHLTRLTSVTMEQLGEKLGFDLTQVSYQVSLADLCPWLSDLKAVSFSGGNMELTYGVGEELFAEVRADAYSAQQAVYFISDVEELSLFVDSFDEGNNALALGDGFTALLVRLEADPGEIEQVRVNCLALANAYQANKAFAGEQAIYLPRLLPNVTQQAVAARHEEIYSLVEGRVALMRALVENMNKLYFKEGVSYSDEALLNAQTGEPLALEQLVDDFAPYESCFSVENSRVMLCTGGIQMIAFGFGTPLKNMPRADGATYPGLDKNEVYMVVLLTRVVDGTPAFVYLFNDGRLTHLTVRPVSEQDYGMYMASETVPAATFD
ncbi:MAG TPA: hypothetical protein VN540_02295 [Clostridia bacterium]|nr:hypothetical protein [Clostridia bacterium]